ncbi:MAG: bacterioferritin [Pseudoalteromonas tetraodonis]|jgi:bacterioferritin|uniref:Bacterioferritin n=3 Tax=Pseudoalteromonas TaxID=53246 RepID=A0A9W4QY58_PSEHA|nr:MULTISPECIES: bacterioferritin [Pseudoalteromonas]ADT70396.1 bacterioferritin (cytochrome B-1) (cytochrome B-557) [Pseudoalteromonas sp. SM9913]ATD05118.1 bacterioferritin [Pseudoalteromonas tetraodonis]EWS96584.1 bacterioferritin [Pseudoalteromonas sp. SCSIO_11900]KAF7763122.1 bacterioferritin [Pseudoalteromonas undina]KPZ65747.1 Bacterioferritin [Pseudoalteromonas sp. P1-16-1b]|tara:strand:- start:223 stop:687 length:465 start_codon:yes stop_codon:yes gene_type:complete
MKGDKDVIAALNKVLANELVGINQYFLHARMFKDFGFSKLDKADYKVSIQKMKNADRLIERILFLEGLPNLQDLGRLRIGENSEEMIAANMSFELDTVDELRAAIKLAESKKDYISREALDNILNEQEEQIDWLETQQLLIKNTGLENYLQSQL